jgi:hypothetical protein
MVEQVQNLGATGVVEQAIVANPGSVIPPQAKGYLGSGYDDAYSRGLHSGASTCAMISSFCSPPTSPESYWFLRASNPLM